MQINHLTSLLQRIIIFNVQFMIGHLSLDCATSHILACGMETY